MTLIQKSILSTLAIYDAGFEYPLTAFEVFKYLTNPLHITGFYFLNKNGDERGKEKGKQVVGLEGVKFNLYTIIENLNSKALKKFVKEKNGFYFLSNNHQEDIVKKRIERQKISIEKWKKAKKTLFWLQMIPYLRMIMVSGSVALNNPHKESDIDVLIIVKKGRLWISRFFITMLLQIMRKRRHKSLIKDRICLNHYITDDSLEIKIHCLCDAQLYAHLVPVLEIKENSKKDILTRFQEANNWINSYVFYWPSLSRRHFKQIKYSKPLRSMGRAGEFILNNKIGDLIEKILRFFQKEIIKRNSDFKKKKGRIKILDTQLIFHPQAPVKKTLEKYNQIMLELNLGEIAKEKELDFFKQNPLAQSSKKGT